MKKATPNEKEFYERYLRKLRSEFQKTNIYLAIICAQEFARKIVSWNTILLGYFTSPIKLHSHEYLAGGSVLATVWNEQFLDYHRRRIKAKKKRLRKNQKSTFKKFITDPLVDPQKKRISAKNWAQQQSTEIAKCKKKIDALNSIILEQMEINDFDIFFTTMPQFNYSKENVLETVGAISISSKNTELERYFETKDSHKLQLIKRIYNSPNNIIGGFDLDPCRLFFSHSFLRETQKRKSKKEKEDKCPVYTTVGGLYALLKLKQVININCQSKNFYYRIKKYSLFKPIHVYSFSNYMTPICSQQEHDYSSFSHSEKEGDYSSSFFSQSEKNETHSSPNFGEGSNFNGEKDKNPLFRAPSFLRSEKEKKHEREKDLEKNLEYLLTGQFEFLFYRNGVVYELSDFLRAFQKKKDPQVFFSKTLARKTPSKAFIKLGLEKIKVFYPRYANLNSTFILKNPHSQFTGSFNPTSYTASEIYLHPRRINFLNEFPQITIVFHALKARIPKQFIYRILRDYFDDIVLKSLKESCPYFSIPT